MHNKSMYETELYHHGVLGMSWGDRHGPPYPLGGQDKAAARADYKRKLDEEKLAEKKRREEIRQEKQRIRQEVKEHKESEKLQKLEFRARQQARKDAVRNAKIAKQKAKLMQEGNIEKIRKNAKLFTTDELRNAITRSSLIEEPKKEEKPKPPSKTGLQKAAEVASAFAAIAVPVGTIVSTMKSINDYKYKVNDNDLSLKIKDLKYSVASEKASKGDLDAAAKELNDKDKSDKKDNDSKGNKITEDDIWNTIFGGGKDKK